MRKAIVAVIGASLPSEHQAAAALTRLGAGRVAQAAQPRPQQKAQLAASAGALTETHHVAV